MNYILLVICTLFFLNSYSQKNEEELLAKNNISKKIVQGFQYRGDSLIKQSYHVHELDQYGNTTAFQVYDPKDSLLLRETTYTFSDDGKIEYGEQVDKDGKLLYSYQIIKNQDTRSLHKLQISPKGDTVVEQFFYQDRNLNDSILFTVRNGRRRVSYKWYYNSDGLLTLKQPFDYNGNPLPKEYYTHQQTGNCIKTKNQHNQLISYICEEGNKKTRKILKDKEGYRAGIKLISEKGGERVETTLASGLIDKIENFSKNGILLAKIQYTYLKRESGKTN